MNSAVVRIFSIFAVLLAFLTSAASAEQNLYQQLAKMAGECRSARSVECTQACLRPSRELRHGKTVPESDIEACRAAYASFESTKPTPEPVWEPEYAPMPDVVGIFRGALVDAKGRDDWKRHCRSSAQINGKALQMRGISKGATVRVSGVRYVTNPTRSFDRAKLACHADSVEVVSNP